MLPSGWAAASVFDRVIAFFKHLWSLCAQVLGRQALHCQLLGVHAVVGGERSLTVLILRVRSVSTYIDFSYVCLLSRSLGLAVLIFYCFGQFCGRDRSV